MIRIDDNCMCSFIEIAFGVNILTSTFEAFRDYGQSRLKKKYFQQVLGWIRLRIAEANDENRKKELINLNQAVSGIELKCTRYLEKICRFWQRLSVATSIVCMAVLYFGMQKQIGLWAGLLLFHWPVFFGTNQILITVYGHKILKKTRLFKEYNKEFQDKDPKDFRIEARKMLGIYQCNHSPVEKSKIEN